jgi:hypothetical protein
MSDSNAENNKALVLEAFDTLFYKRDYVWSPDYRTWPRKSFQSHQEPSANAQVRARKDRGRRRFRDRARMVLEFWASRELDCGGHRSNEGWLTSVRTAFCEGTSTPWTSWAAR